MILRVLLAIAAITGSGQGDPRVSKQDWSVICLTYDGKASIIRNLFLHEAAQVADKLDGFGSRDRSTHYLYMPPKPQGPFGPGLRLWRGRNREPFSDFGGASSFTTHLIDPSDIRTVSVIGPADWQENCFFSMHCR